MLKMQAETRQPDGDDDWSEIGRDGGVSPGVVGCLLGDGVSPGMRVRGGGLSHGISGVVGYLIISNNNK